jgi:hypothetical protein
MPGCVLRISGADFDLEAHLATTSIPVYKSHRKGEPHAIRRGVTHQSNGFSANVSDSDGILSEEVRDAISFLHTHHESLKRLADDPSVSHRTLDFGYYRRDCTVMCEVLPSELLRLAGELDINIELSLYPSVDS